MPERKKKLGEILVEAGLINDIQLKSALATQKSWGGRLGSHLIHMGFLSEDALTKFLSKQMGIPYVNLYGTKMSKKAIALLSADIVEKYHVLPIGTKVVSGHSVLYVAMSDPTNIEAIDEIQFLTGLTVKPVVASDSALEGAIGFYYHGKQWSKRIQEAPSAHEQPDNMIVVRGMIEETSLSDSGRRPLPSPPPNHRAARIPPVQERTEGKHHTSAPQDPAVYQPTVPSQTPGTAASRGNMEKTLFALIALLIKKGLITKEEIDTEFSRHSQT